MPGFSYRRPACLDEALDLLAQDADGIKLLAGGQSLVPMISLGLAKPAMLVDINRLPGLDYAACRGTVLAVGPLRRHAALEAADSALAMAAPLVPLAAAQIGHLAIRTRGTMLGSLAHGDPSAEWPAVALALGAEMVLVSVRGERTVAASDFFLGPLTTALEPDELLREVRLPVATARTGASIQELTYRHGDYAVVGVVAQVSLAEDGSISHAHLGLLSVGDTPIQATAAERVLLGAGPAAFDDAAEAAQAAADPATDATASAGYRREMVRVFTRRALAEAYERARSRVPARTA
jgi:aerobic carbon-monoxide dehydrogenase medium subunit